MLDDDFLESDRDETIRRPVNHRETSNSDESEAIAPPQWPVGTNVGGYQIGQVIGNGKYSTVYAVHELKTGNPLALKLLRTKSPTSILTNRLAFRNMLPLSHPSLIKMGQLIKIDQYIGMTMERVQGRRLCDEVPVMRKAPREQLFDFAYELLRQIGGALAVMHANSLVHRDVKPDNIMYDHRGRFRLIDYGIVGQCDPEYDPDARRNYLAGTFWYMAPESIYDQIYPPACDVYSLGCVTLELLADHRRLPEQKLGTSLGQVVRDVRRLLLPDTPADLAELIIDMIDTDPENRPLASRVARIGLIESPQYETEHKVRPHGSYGRDSDLNRAERWANEVACGKRSRLHISGPSGVGKTWFLDELKRRLRNNAWFQVFDSCCYERTDLPLHTFDSIVDLITKRYSRDDRDPIRLSVTSASILCQAFPALKAIIEMEDPQTPEEVAICWATKDTPSQSKDDEADFDSDSEAQVRRDAYLTNMNTIRTEALQAGLDFNNKLSALGPQFLVIDDIQWADRDSINVLEKILAEADGPVGVITVGRDESDPFLEAPDLHIELSLLSIDRCVEMLEAIFKKNGMKWEPRALIQLAKLSEGNVFRLTQLAACIVLDRPLHWHQRLCDETVEIEEIWQGRIDLVSTRARSVLEYLAIAEGPTQLTDLEQLSGLQENLSEAIDELLNMNLIVESKKDFRVVDIVHKRVRDRLLMNIDPESASAIHHRWAVHFKQFDDREWMASRIAGHLLKAQRADEAFDYVLRAAEEAALRFAFTDAAQWHRTAAELCDGLPSLSYRCRAIEKFEKAGQPAQAAADCERLLAHPLTAAAPWAWRMIHLRSAHNWLQCGQFGQVRSAIEQAQAVPWEAQAAGVYPAEPSHPLVLFVSDSEPICRTMHQRLYLVDNKLAKTAWRLALQTIPDCEPIARQHLFSDLHLANSARRVADPCSRSDVSAENGSLDQLSDLGRQACLDWLGCDWQSAIHKVSQIKPHLDLVSHDKLRFSPSLLTMVESWSNVWLGRLAEQSKSYRYTFVKIRERNDEFMRRCLLSGVGVTSLLIHDQVESARDIHVELSRQTFDPKSLGANYGRASRLFCVCFIKIVYHVACGIYSVS